MAGGYGQGSSDPMVQFTDQIRLIWEALRDLQRPTGTSIASLVKQVQAALANVNATVTAAIEANSYTASEIDAKIANPADVAVSGTLNVAGAAFLVDARNNPVTSNYYALYSNADNRVGVTPSSRRFKQDIQNWSPELQAVFALQLVTFHYKAAVAELGHDAPLEWGLIAEDVHDLGLTWLVVYDNDGKPYTIAYEKIGALLLPIIQDHQSRLAAAESAVQALTARVEALQVQ